MIKKAIFTAGLVSTLLVGCSTTKTHQTPPTTTYSNIELNGKLYAAIFQQSTAEYQALCLQAFNIATLQLDLLLQENHTKPLAIVTDIDETFLDNSPYAVQMAREGKVFDETTWNTWTSKGNALPVAGSLDFFKYAASKGVEIFYITNRSQADRKGTLENLKKYDFPFSDNMHLIVRETESSKETRRQKVSETHEIVMLLGDNLSDFSNAFDKKNMSERLDNVYKNASLFGKKFIVLPNSGYGDWESAIFDYKRDWTTSQKDSIYNSKLQGF